MWHQKKMMWVGRMDGRSGKNISIPLSPNLWIQTKPNQNKLDKNKQLVQVYLSHMHAAANEEGFCRRYATYSSVFKLSLLPFKLHLAIHFIKKNTNIIYLIVIKFIIKN
jgi:hypothetical protein